VKSWITVIYGEVAPSYATVKHWAADFWGRRSLDDEPLLGRPSEAVCEAKQTLVLFKIWWSKIIESCATDMLMPSALWSLSISTCSITMILRKHLLMTKVCARCVPWMLDQIMKDCQHKVWSENLELRQLDWDAEGVLLIDFMPHKETVTGVYCADLLLKLLLTIKEKWRRKLSQVPLHLHDYTDYTPDHRSHAGQAALFESLC